MRWLAPALAVLLLLCSAGAGAETPRPEIVTSPGGITAWLINEPSVPVISLRFAFKGGGALDPPGKEGLANLVTTLLDEGAGEMDALAYQTRLEELAVHLGFSADRDFFYGNLSTLTRNRDAAFDLLRLALNAPRFDADPVERMRRRMIVSLTQDLESPHAIAGRHWFKKSFGEHPYWHATDGSIEGVEAIGHDDLAGFVGRRFARDNLQVAVVGDITAEALGPILDRTFGDLPARSGPVAVTPVEPALVGGVEVIRRQMPQSVVFFGLPGLKRDDPDWYAWDLMVQILGGGTQTSRLHEAVREKRGLAYSVYSYPMVLQATGLLLGGAGTRNEKVAEALEIIRAEIARMRDEGVSEQELADTKLYVNGSFPLRLTSSGSIATLLLAMQIHHLGVDYLERRPEIYNRITTADVKRVAQRMLKPELLEVVIVGDPAGLD